MAGLWGVLSTGKTSLNTHQIGVNTVSHNISNVNTPGYSRQRAILENRDPFHTRSGQIGMGVDILTIDRMNGNYVHRQMVGKNAEFGFQSKSYNLLQEVEMVFSDRHGADIQNAMVEFFDSFRTLSTKPDDVNLRQNTKAKAEAMIDRFHRVDNDLDRMQEEMNPEIDAMVQKVNLLTEEISKLNKEISMQEHAGHQANDLRDRQELRVRELAEIVEVDSFTDNRGFLNVWLDSGEPLVSGKDSYDMVTIQQTNGLKNIAIDRGNQRVDITDNLRGGQLGALVEIRDVTIESYKGRLDSLAQTVASEVNNIHASGYGLDLGQRDFFSVIDAAEPFSADNISLHTDIENSLDAIAAGQINDAQSIYGDNRNAIALSDLIYNDTFFGNGETFANHYQATVSKIGHDVSATEGKLNYVKSEVEQLSAFREELVGVNIDEELVELNKFQKAYEASSRIINTANDMIDTILRLKS